MEIGQEMIIGRLGQQPMHIADPSVDPQHAVLRRLTEEDYQIEDNNSSTGMFVFGLRFKRKRIKLDTPIFLGKHKTSVRLLMKDASEINLGSIWSKYENEKKKWDRYTNLVNSIRMLTPILTMMIAQVAGNDWKISVGVLVVVTVIAIFAGEKVLAKKTIRMAELNAQMQQEYVCPQCHHFLGFIPYTVLKQKRYCPNPTCGVPLK